MRSRSSPLGHHINRAPEQLLEFHHESAEIEKAAAGLQIDEEVNVAVGASFAAGDRAKDADVPRPVSRRNSQDLLPLSIYFRRSKLHAHILRASAPPALPLSLPWAVIR